jgi:adenine-specific DNA-methyltransferase
MQDKYKLHPSDIQSMDLSSTTLDKLKQLLPDIFSETILGKPHIDIAKLKLALGDEVDIDEDNQTRYSFVWSGKKQAQLEANKPTKAMLRPCIEESKHWDSTQNVYIEGDNLEVLKLLQKSYYGKIKMIYIDPPYNTGKDFVYKDNYHDNLANYLQLTGQVDGEGNRVSTNSDSSGRYHTDWLNMMYPRLKLARNLLKDDGVIFISIDDNEVHNLRKICDEIFGEDNVETLVWNKEADGKSGTLKQTLRYRNIHEYIIVCYKFKENVLFNRISEPLIDKENRLETANLAVNAGKERDGHPNWFELIAPNGKSWNKHWKFDRVTIEEFITDDLIYWGKDGNNQPRLVIPTDYRRRVYPISIIEKGSTTNGRKDFEDVLGSEVFSYPKPLKLLDHLLRMATNKNDIILDFFSGSATTAHAVMQLNAEDNGKRKYICVQLPEATKEDSEAYKAGYKNICEIGKERIRRAGEKVIAQLQTKQQPNDLLAQDSAAPNMPDVGFKVFKLDTSNIKPFNHNDLLDLNLFVENRTSLDLFYELVLKQGYTLEHKQDIRYIGGTKCYVLLQDNKPFVLAVLDDIVKNDFMIAILKYPLSLLIIKDSCFSSDEVKLNALATLEQLQSSGNTLPHGNELQIRII